MIVRRYESQDAGPVSTLIRTTMRVSNTVDYPIEKLQPLMDYFSPQKVEQLSAERVCLVAADGEKIVGTIGLEEDTLATFFVHPHYQGQGIGSALLDALERSAKAQGLSALYVDSSLTAASFYAKRGYRRTGQVFDGTAGPQIRMHKSLNQGSA